METVGVIPAAGSGTRLGLPTPKAFIDLAGRTIVEHAVSGMQRAGIDTIVVAVPATLTTRARSLFANQPGVTVVTGGAERTESVYRALQSVSATPRFVLVHDAARCLTPPQVFTRVLHALRAGATNVVPVLPVADTVRPVTQQGSGENTQPEVAPTDAEPLGTPIDRASLRAVQTPQGAAFGPLVAAHAAYARGDLGSGAVTDDASLLEVTGYPAVGVAGHSEAFKITHPMDLDLARMLLSRRGLT